MLRRWRWERLRGRTEPPMAPAATRPGDDAVSGGALYCAGLQQGDEDKVAQGLRLLLTAADLAICGSGITREGSSLRQQQLVCVYRDAWLAARRHGRPEQWRLAAIARSLIAALAAITLPGGLPLIGAAPQPPAGDPFAAEDPTDAAALAELRRQAQLFDLESLRPDGWLRLDQGAWSGLWHCPPGGWIMADGLAHQDLGAAELHWRGMPLFVDPGAPAAAQNGQAHAACAARAHGGLTLAGRDPYPATQPFYSAAFQGLIAGPPPSLRSTADGASLCFDGFGRFGGHCQIERHWRLRGDMMTLDDLVLGTGRPRIERRLVTACSVARLSERSVRLQLGDVALGLTSDQPISLQSLPGWTASGAPRALTLILIAQAVNLPWRGSLSVAPLSP